MCAAASIFPRARDRPRRLFGSIRPRCPRTPCSSPPVFIARTFSRRVSSTLFRRGWRVYTCKLLQWLAFFFASFGGTFIRGRYTNFAWALPSWAAFDSRGTRFERTRGRIERAAGKTRQLHIRDAFQRMGVCAKLNRENEAVRQSVLITRANINGARNCL